MAMRRRAASWLLALLASGLLLAVGWAITPAELRARVAAWSGHAPAEEPAAFRYAAAPARTGEAVDTCLPCHSLDRDGPLRVAPSLWGIVDAPKARFAWYGYSPALRGKGGTWSVEELDRFLADPPRWAPGTKKTITGLAPEERRKVIAALQKLRD
jgi:cytochrome c